jgi:hypothetical protein
MSLQVTQPLRQPLRYLAEPWPLGQSRHGPTVSPDLPA